VGVDATSLPRRVAASLAVLLFFGAQGAGGLHLAIVKHEVCDHGQVVHGDHAEAEHDDASTAAFIAGHDDAHEHCSVPQAQGGHARSIATANVTPRFVKAAGEPRALLSATLPSAARYRFAPKQSPPA
jgi:hypothetical protein